MIITIDGPVASGKSTVACLLAQHLGALYLNSGLLYRALAYFLSEQGYTPEQMQHMTIEKVKQLVDVAKFSYVYDDGHASIRYDARDLTPLLKNAVIDQAASCLSTVPAVRAFVNDILRATAHGHTVVIDGRDAGSVIFPDATHKFFLTASPHVRAQRWQADQAQRGNQYTLQEALAEVNKRDERDSTRAVAPLSVPEGAVLVSTDTDSVLQVVAKLQATLC